MFAFSSLLTFWLQRTFVVLLLLIFDISNLVKLLEVEMGSSRIRIYVVLIWRSFNFP